MMFNSVENMTHSEKVLLWVFGKLENLADLGLVNRGKISISVKGISVFDQLEVEFTPSKWETVQCLIGAEIVVNIQDLLPITHLLYLDKNKAEELYIQYKTKKDK